MPALSLENIRNDLNNNLKSFTEIINKLNLCDADPGEEIKNILNMYLKTITTTERKTPFVITFDEAYKLYPDAHISTFKNDMEIEILKHKAPSIDAKQANIKKLDKIEDVDLQGNVLNLPVIDKLSKLPPAFYWFNGNATYAKGIYINMCTDFYVKVPFPNVLNGSEKNYKTKTIKCKHITIEECTLNRKRMSEFYRSPIKSSCFYVHKKEKFNKVGFPFRRDIEYVGNYDTLDISLKMMTHFDIKHMLMYSLSDDLIALLWYQNKFKNGRLILSSLDTF
jgi:hypothetical protein